MSTQSNKRLIEHIFSGEVDFLECWAEDGEWIVTGTTKWSGTYSGKKAIIEGLLRPLGAQIANMGTVNVTNIIAEGDFVIVEAQVSNGVTIDGKPYNNAYCFVYKIAGGKIKSLTEYCDTELVTEAFGK